MECRDHAGQHEQADQVPRRTRLTQSCFLHEGGGYEAIRSSSRFISACGVDRELSDRFIMSD
jgi:hypothetical protein